MNTTENRTIQIVHTFNTSIERMWEMWTKPEHIAQWWGPNGFSSTIHTMEVKENGEWKMTLHGPDGTNFPNKSIYMEIVPYKKIVFEHFYPHFITTVIFESLGNETLIDWTMQFDTPELRETIVNVHKADEGQKQNIERLEKYLSESGNKQANHS